jgi:hypothetical protein
MYCKQALYGFNRILQLRSTTAQQTQHSSRADDAERQTTQDDGIGGAILIGASDNFSSSPAGGVKMGECTVVNKREHTDDKENNNNKKEKMLSLRDMKSMVSK